MDFKRIHAVRNRVEQESVIADDADHFLHATLSRFRFDRILQHGGANAQVEPSVLKRQRLPFLYMMKAATIRNAVELGALTRDSDFFLVDVDPYNVHVRAHHRQSYRGASGLATEIEHVSYSRCIDATLKARHQVSQMMVDNSKIVAGKHAFWNTTPPWESLKHHSYKPVKLG